MSNELVYIKKRAEYHRDLYLFIDPFPFNRSSLVSSKPKAAFPCTLSLTELSWGTYLSHSPKSLMLITNNYCQFWRERQHMGKETELSLTVLHLAASCHKAAAVASPMYFLSVKTTEDTL